MRNKRKAASTTALQQFGTVETANGIADAMLCIDADRPDEFMVHIWGQGLKPMALHLTAAQKADGSIELRPKSAYQPAENGALFQPVLSLEERQQVEAISAQLKHAKTGLRGKWKGHDGKTRNIQFEPWSEGDDVVATSCATWDEFKRWAGQSRQTLDAGLYRGHGSSKFTLQTTLHRAGRHRLERYCADTLLQFHAQAEAVLGIRLNMNDGNDYSIVLGLGQHHGLPTPLLDWTESPYIAAFFAFADALEATPYRPDATHVRIFALTREFVDQYSPSTFVLPFISPYVGALAISPRLNLRLQAQQGRFLVTNVANLERLLVRMQAISGRPLLHAIDIPISEARAALEDLAFMGVTAATMFPGLDGICRKIRHQMEFVRSPIPDASQQRIAVSGLQDSSQNTGSIVGVSQDIEITQIPTKDDSEAKAG